MAVQEAATLIDQYAQDYLLCCNRALAISGESKEYFARRRLEWLARRLRGYGIPPPRRIIDFGCGVGDVTSLIPAYFPGADVVGLDVSQRFIERARSEHASSVVRFDLVDDYSACNAAAADLVHCNGVIHHVQPSERNQVVATMTSLVGRGGTVCVFENNPWNPGTRWVMHRIPFDQDVKMIRPAGVRKLLRTNGLEIRETAHLLFFPRILRVLRKLEPALTRVPFGAQYGVLGTVAASRGVPTARGGGVRAGIAA